MNNKESFKNVVKSIKDAEKRVDEVLDAARLERVEKPRMTDARLDMIFENLILLATVIGFFGLLAMMFFMAMH